jgi:hypothetical protein
LTSRLASFTAAMEPNRFVSPRNERENTAVCY